MKDYIKTYSTFITYIFVPYLIILLSKLLFNRTYSSDSINDLIFFNTVCDLILMVIIIALSLDVLKKKKKITGKTKKEKIINFIKLSIIVSLAFFGAKIVVGIFVSILLSIFNLSDTAINQQLVEEMFKSAPLLNILTGTICAPIVEELVFRGSIRRVIKDKRVFVIVSGLLFGLVHVLRYDLPIFAILITGCLIDVVIVSKLPKKKKVSLSIFTSLIMLLVLTLSLHLLSGNIITLLTTVNLSEVINSITYIALGCFLAMLYVKYDNIYLNIACHMVNNFIAYMTLLALL